MSLNPVQFFHGMQTPLEGDTILPASKRGLSDDDINSGFGRLNVQSNVDRAYATTDEDAAWRYGTTVHKVEPIGQFEMDRNHHSPDGEHYESADGWRVLSSETVPRPGVANTPKSGVQARLFALPDPKLGPRGPDRHYENNNDIAARKYSAREKRHEALTADMNPVEKYKADVAEYPNYIHGRGGADALNALMNASHNQPALFGHER